MEPEEKRRKNSFSGKGLHVSLATLERNCIVVLCNTDFFRTEQAKSAWNSSELQFEIRVLNPLLGTHPFWIFLLTLGMYVELYVGKQS